MTLILGCFFTRRDLTQEDAGSLVGINPYEAILPAHLACLDTEQESHLMKTSGSLDGQI